MTNPQRPGWYQQADGSKRYWDGKQWAESVPPPLPPTPEAPIPPHADPTAREGNLFWVLAVIPQAIWAVLTIILALIFGDSVTGWGGTYALLIGGLLTAIVIVGLTTYLNSLRPNNELDDWRRMAGWFSLLILPLGPLLYLYWRRSNTQFWTSLGVWVLALILVGWISLAASTQEELNSLDCETAIPHVINASEVSPDSDKWILSVANPTEVTPTGDELFACTGTATLTTSQTESIRYYGVKVSGEVEVEYTTQ